MPFQIPDATAPLEQFLAMVGQQTNAAQTQQRNDAEVFAQAKRFEQQLREKKQQEAIEAALATLQQTGQASPQNVSILKSTPYGGMLDQGNRLVDNPDTVRTRQQRLAEHQARLAQIQASTELAKTRKGALDQTAEGIDELAGTLGETQDPAQWLISGIQSGALKPEQGLRMYLQHMQNQKMNQFRQSRPVAGSASAGARVVRDSDSAALAGLMAELPGELQQFNNDPAAMAKAAVEHQKELGLSGMGLKTYVDAIFRYAKEQ